MSWYYWLGIILGTNFFTLLLAQCIPNGNPILWLFKLKRYQWYRVLAVAPIRTPEVSKDECAIVQDVFSLYNPFLVFLPPKKDYSLNPGDMISWDWKQGRPVLVLEAKKSIPKGQAC